MSVNNNHLPQKPVIFLAFANDRMDGVAYLRNLPVELRGIREALDKAVKAGLCEVVERANASVDDIMDVFQDQTYQNRIALFHYGGHADCFRLLLESFAGRLTAAHKAGLVSFLGRQEELKFIFLNGCSSQQHAMELTDAGIPAVVGTSQAIDDAVATLLSIRFYNGLANGFSIERAWQDAADEIKIKKGVSDLGEFYRQGKQDKEDRFPWDIFYKRGGEKVKGWNLPEAANDPLFGLPEIPSSYGFPESPFLFLRRYEKKHAQVFFGRSFYIHNLYNRIADPKSPGIILLHGQSGVGKSSLLEAGLLPRLEDSHSIIYARRVREKGLLGTFQKALEEHPLIRGEKQALENLTNVGKWQLIESGSGKPLIFILDQAEEMYTRPNEELPGEFTDFLDVLKKIFRDPCFTSKGKLILTYRKEYHPEIDKKLASYELPRSWLFLEPLSREDIIDVITGLSKTPGLKQHYRNIGVEEDLPVIIADDLLEDRNSPIAPVLQILLTRMWHRILQEESSGNVRFTVQAYQRLRKEGIAMDDFFKQQMTKLRAWNPDVVDSGLALDVLRFHTTRLSTSCTRSAEDIRQIYLHSQDMINDLVQKLKDLYLLTDTQQTREETGLPHDTLAPLIVKKCNDSRKPGQRAARILAAKIEDFKRDESRVWLDEGDLEIVEQGKSGMRQLTPDEEQLLKVSRQRKAQQEKEKKRNKRIRIVSIMCIVIFALFAVYQWKTASDRSRRSEANRLALTAEREVVKDPTIALRIAEQAYRLDQNETVTAVIHKIYRENNFYKIIASQEDNISCAVFSPDGKTILTGSGSEDKIATLWNRQGQQKMVFKGHKASITSAAFSPDNQCVLTGSKDRTARLWDMQGDEIEILRGHKDWVCSVAFSPGGETILTGSRDRTARLWNLQGEVQRVFRGHEQDILSVTFSPDGRFILTGSVDGTARLWDLQGKEIRNYKHEDWVNSVVFSPDGKTILTGCRDTIARLYDLAGKNLSNYKGHKGSVNSIAFSPDCKCILTGSEDRTVTLWDFQGNKIQDFKGHKDRIVATAFSPDNQYILTGSWDKTIGLWNLKGAKFRILDRHKDDVTGTAFSPDGSHILTGSGDGTARLYNIRGEELKVFDGHEDWICSVAFSPDGKTVLTGSRDKTARLWDMQAKEITVFRGHKDRVTSVVFSPDGRFILTGSWDDTARLWNLEGKLIRDYTGHDDDVDSVAFSPNGRHILTGSLDKTARLWNLKGRLIRSFENPGSLVRSAVFSPDGKHILIAANEGIEVNVRLWDLKGNKLQVFKGHKYRIPAVAFSPDGNYILTGSWDKTARLWDLQGNKLQDFKNHEGKVNSVAFSPCGKYILTGSSDGAVRLWEVKMTLEDFLRKGSCEELDEEQKRIYEIEE